MTVGILSFRLPLFDNLERNNKKAIHGTCWLLALFCMSFGLYAVFESHNDTGTEGTYYANMYSLHSWIGIGVFSLFLGQFVAGSLLYGFKVGGDGVRKEMMSVHKVRARSERCMDEKREARNNCSSLRSSPSA